MSLEKNGESGFDLHSENVLAGVTSGPLLLYGVKGPKTVTALPGGGGTALVEMTTSSPSAIDGSAANWVQWPLGTVSADSQLQLSAVATAVRFTATTAAADFEVVA